MFLAELLDRMLDHEPTERPTAAEAVATLAARPGEMATDAEITDVVHAWRDSLFRSPDSDSASLDAGHLDLARRIYQLPASFKRAFGEFIEQLDDAFDGAGDAPESRQDDPLGIG